MTQIRTKDKAKSEAEKLAKELIKELNKQKASPEAGPWTNKTPVKKAATKKSPDIEGEDAEMESPGLENDDSDEHLCLKTIQSSRENEDSTDEQESHPIREGH